MYPGVHCGTVYAGQDKQTKCPPTDEQIKKMGYIYSVEVYSVMKSMK